MPSGSKEKNGCNGLNEKNIATAIKIVAPAALDINSGVEASPGRKDHAKLARIFDIVWATDTALVNSQLIFKKRTV